MFSFMHKYSPTHFFVYVLISKNVSVEQLNFGKITNSCRVMAGLQNYLNMHGTVVRKDRYPQFIKNIHIVHRKT